MRIIIILIMGPITGRGVCGSSLLAVSEGFRTALSVTPKNMTRLIFPTFGCLLRKLAILVCLILILNVYLIGVVDGDNTRVPGNLLYQLNGRATEEIHTHYLKQFTNYTSGQFFAMHIRRGDKACTFTSTSNMVR